MYLGKLVILILHIITCINQYESTPLDDYVNAPDPHFGWTVIKTYEEPDYTLYIVNFTSQKWIDETFSTRSIWWHYLCINVPNHLTRSKTAFMLIDGGSNTDGMPQPNDESVALMSMLAVSTGTWTSAAVDSKRIIGAVPIVMDLVNLQISLNGWTFALKDFYALNIFRSLDTNNFTRMAEIIDPYNYFNRYKTIKTLQIQTTGDEFFLLDNEICRLS
ncbi:unnamed protein product [Rotaria sp. Silwood1]|nr:unnamed protein product [Rotaria sp. Silwood1]